MIVADMNQLADVVAEHEQVVEVSALLPFLSRAAVRWQLDSGRWQQPSHGVIVTHSGPLTDIQRLRVAVSWAGPGAALAGLTAARLDGFEGFTDRNGTSIHLVVPAGWSSRRASLDLPLVVHYSRLLRPADIHPVKQPRRTRIARSLIDAASWMPTARGAQAVLAAGVQQGLTTVEDLADVTQANLRLRRRKLIACTLADIAGGARALSELDFTRLVIRAYRLPEPDRQRRRKDSHGKNRYLDGCWDSAKLVAEVDGAQHMDPLQHWDDMNRDNDLTIGGYRVLRFPAWLVRYHPELVAAKLRSALRRPR
ncbi:MAG TPA: DUF559 domain-containing protein [Streptosporangiaceae bacterium]|nr:DUF559 domain-containing protein [Streptosporangiaceae bacterium]